MSEFWYEKTDHHLLPNFWPAIWILGGTTFRSFALIELFLEKIFKLIDKIVISKGLKLYRGTNH